MHVVLIYSSFSFDSLCKSLSFYFPCKLAFGRQTRTAVWAPKIELSYCRVESNSASLGVQPSFLRASSSYLESSHFCGADLLCMTSSFTCVLEIYINHLAYTVSFFLYCDAPGALTTPLALNSPIFVFMPLESVCPTCKEQTIPETKARTSS